MFAVSTYVSTLHIFQGAKLHTYYYSNLMSRLPLAKLTVRLQAAQRGGELSTFGDAQKSPGRRLGQWALGGSVWVGEVAPDDRQRYLPTTVL